MVSEPRNKRLLVAAGMQQPVGEDMPALAIGAELDLVDGEKGEAAMRSASPRPWR